MTMRKYILASIAMLPLLLSCSQAEQNWSVDPPAQPWVFSSDDSGTSSYLGVDISDMTTERLSALKLKDEKGVEVTMVDQDAPAGKAGIKEHDVILTMNGTSIESGAQLRRMIHETPPGRVVTLGLSRDGQPMNVKVQLADKHKEFDTHSKSKEFHFELPNIHVTTPDIDIPAINMVMVTSSLRSGLMVENITPQLGDFFGVKGGKGVLVRSVEKGSRGEKAGFHAGDVVVKVNGQPVHDTSDFTHALRSSPSRAAAVTVMREKREQNLTLTLPDKKDSGSLLEDTLNIPEISADTEQAINLAQEEIARINPAIVEKLQHNAERPETAKERGKEREQRQRDRQQRMQEWQQNLRREFYRKWTEI